MHPASAVNAADFFIFGVTATIKRAQVKITASLVDAPLAMVRVEATVNDQICESEEHAAYATWMFGETVCISRWKKGAIIIWCTLQKRVEN